jgi:hypothetical protein
MKTVRLFLVVILIPMRLLAGNHTISYTAGQETAIQNRLLPLINAYKCASKGLGPTCNTAQLVAAGCVAVAFPSVRPLFNTCNIYSLDAAGLDQYLKDKSDKALVDDFILLNAADYNAYVSPCRAATPTQIQNSCLAIPGAPATCNPCP